MVDIIRQIFGTLPSDYSVIYAVCGALIVIFTVIIIDLVYRIFGHFWRPRR